MKNTYNTALYFDEVSRKALMEEERIYKRVRKNKKKYKKRRKQKTWNKRGK